MQNQTMRRNNHWRVESEPAWWMLMATAAPTRLLLTALSSVVTARAGPQELSAPALPGELPPSSAWNEAVRRAVVFSIAGFFVLNLLANFGVIPQLPQSFQFMPGVCVAVGVFSMSLALFIGQYHHKLIQGMLLGIAGLVLPYSATWLWFRITHPSSSASLLQLFGPTAIVAIGTYLAFLR